MKKKYWWIIPVAVVVVLAVLFLPYRIGYLNDGGTTEYCALTYRVVDWKRITEDGYYENRRTYFLGDVFKPIDELWEREAPNVEHKFIATILELNDSTALVEPLEHEDERNSSDQISFAVKELPDIGAKVGSVVQVTYYGAIRESYPATIDATAWEISENLRHIAYTKQWINTTTAEPVENTSWNVTITRIYQNCFFATSDDGTIFEVKVNGTLSDEWCVGDLVLVEFESLYRDSNNRYEGEMERVRFAPSYDDEITFYKPVIYLYPEEETEVSVKLTLDGELICTYPTYGDGWAVTASADGTLRDAQGQTYNYLYWEGKTDAQWDLTSGFCVRGEDTAAFLENALAKLGLNRREANEFIVYWLPLMEGNAYNIISFQTDAYTDAARLDIAPQPDTLIRVFMAWQSADSYVELEEQELTAPDRSGFTAVEWGGTEIG